MHRPHLSKPSPAMAVAFTALVVAASGTAVAATNLVSGDKLIKKHSLSGNRLRNHTLTGTQINLSKLGTVPSAAKAKSATTADSSANAAHATAADSAANAAHATLADSATNAAHAIDADTVAGHKVVTFSLKGPASSGPQTMFDLGGLKLALSCNGSNNPVVTATNDSPAAAEFEFVRVTNTSTLAESGTAAFMPAASVDVLGSATTGHVSFSFYRIDGPAVTGQFAFDNNPAFGSFVGCAAGGTAMGG